MTPPGREMQIMRDKKIVILTALGILAVISLIYGLTARPGARRGVSRQEGIIKKKSESAKPEDIANQMKRRARRTQFRSWRRSPFVSNNASGMPYSKLTLNGILVNGNELKAMIGDSVVGKGARIEGNTVVEVRKDRVILNDGTRDFELKLEQ